jgi:hypothetical protein
MITAGVVVSLSVSLHLGHDFSREKTQSLPLFEQQVRNMLLCGRFNTFNDGPHVYHLTSCRVLTSCDVFVFSPARRSHKNISKRSAVIDPA